MLSLTIKFSKFFEYRSDYVKNKQIADEFDPTFKNKQFRRIRPFLRHETKRVDFVGMPTNSPPLRNSLLKEGLPKCARRATSRQAIEAVENRPSPRPRSLWIRPRIDAPSWLKISIARLRDQDRAVAKVKSHGGEKAQKDGRGTQRRLDPSRIYHAAECGERHAGEDGAGDSIYGLPSFLRRDCG